MAANAAKPLAPSLEQAVNRFRRETQRARERGLSTNYELEVRAQDIDYSSFAALYGALLAKKSSDGRDVPVGPGELVQVVSTILVQPTGSETTRVSRPMRIREIFFEGGRKAREQYVHKEPLLILYRARRRGGMDYAVALSAESPEGSEGFVTDEAAIIRIKARVSFSMKLPPATPGLSVGELWWRIDLTATRQIMGSDAGSLPQIVGQMFRTSPPMRADTLLSSLGLEADAARRSLYRYEVEAEFVGPPDALRPADVMAAADQVLGLVRPEDVREAALQSLVFRVAQTIVKAPAFLE